VSPLTGGSATSFAGFVEAAQARFDEENAKGGVGGRKIVLETNDDQGDGAIQVVAARNAVDGQGAFGILAASRINTMFEYLRQQSVPVIGFPGQADFQKDENLFGYSGAGNQGYVQTAYAERMKAGGATSVAVIAHNSPGSVNGLKAFVQSAEAVGLDVGLQVTDVPVGAFDATALAIQMKEAGVDSLYAPTVTDSSVSVLRALAQQGVTLKSPYVAQLYNPDVASQISPQIQGVLTAPTWVKPTELDDADVKAYTDTMRKYAGDTEPSLDFAHGGYISADLFIRGVTEAGDCLTRESFIKGLRGVTDYDGAGLLLEPAGFSGGDAANGSTPGATCIWFVTREGDAWVPDPKETCGDLPKLAA
jgi:branched-chain amino acid transport system substrate-binding protein